MPTTIAGEYVSFLAVLNKMEYVLDLTLKRQEKNIDFCDSLVLLHKGKVKRNDFKKILMSALGYDSIPYRKFEMKRDKELYKRIFSDHINLLVAVFFEDEEVCYSKPSIQYGLKLVLGYMNAQLAIIKQCKTELQSHVHYCSDVATKFSDLYEQYSVDAFSSIGPRKEFGTLIDNIAILMPLKLLKMFMLLLQNECEFVGIAMNNETNGLSFNVETETEEVVFSDVLRIKLCETKAIASCLSRLSGISKKVPDHIKSSLRSLIAQKGMVNGVILDDSYSDKIKLLYEQFPHLSGLFEMIESHLDLLSLGGGEKQLSLLPSPIILDGCPGTGKTMVAEALAKLFNTGYEIIGGAELTNPFDITGMSGSWSTGKPGMISQMLIEQQKVSPVIVIDEIDKMGDRGSNMSPHDALYTLFEPQSAKRFKDEYFDFECDASHINWICTSNDLTKIPAPIRDRSQIINVPIPTLEQRISIVQYVYRNMQHENKWGEYFSTGLEESLAYQIATLSEDSIRMMKHLIMRCFTQIAKENKGRDIEGGLEFHKQAISIAEASLNCIAKTDNQRIGFL